ncbi:DUF2523 family protein [Moraxella equi]|uniref:Protein of uncharacterized function (DUF2523) n=1 Tax=Moraxella equi TaxID=60442 RepID=A0A378QNL3_9GAMM|nr:DUF2523 family protein [Moraxella equi]OPH38123.1 hypothetical protein B5J93_06980 [Moraxella equi]STZ02486.1 Protein of uncharacterised function (DUF2523) [Moraxella equi]STZ02499.1 Protein of uncharacterised function (DUF2523) [Moraxella equi]STZ02511.1 Protein of uncharacterised function (DUF2523) [Moraxella equi]STZ02523.1 Protein of uncharacterised function (DUF2523) [Moraxella equi]
MGALLKKLLDLVLQGSLKNVLLGAGLGVASSAISFAVINYYIGKLVNYLSNFGTAGQFGNAVIALFGIAGLDVAFSIIIGAYVVKFTIKSTRLFITKGK